MEYNTITTMYQTFLIFGVTQGNLSKIVIPHPSLGDSSLRCLRWGQLSLYFFTFIHSMFLLSLYSLKFFIQFLKVNSVYSYYSTLAIYPGLYNISLQPFLGSVICTSHCHPVFLASRPCSPLGITRLSSINASLLLFCYIHQFVVFFQILPISNILQYFTVCLISLSVMSFHLYF